MIVATNTIWMHLLWIWGSFFPAEMWGSLFPGWNMRKFFSRLKYEEVFSRLKCEEVFFPAEIWGSFFPAEMWESFFQAEVWGSNTKPYLFKSKSTKVGLFSSTAVRLHVLLVNRSYKYNGKFARTGISTLNSHISKPVALCEKLKKISCNYFSILGLDWWFQNFP